MYYYCTLVIVFVIYVLSFYNIDMLPKNESFQYISMAVFLAITIWYMVRNRGKTLFSPEIIIFAIGFLITFYNILVLNNIGFVSRLFLQFSEEMGRKSICLSIIGFDAFMIGGEIAKRSYLKKQNKLKSNVLKVSPFLTVLMHLLALLAILLVFITGRYVAFMKYTLEEGEGANMMNTMLSVLIMVSSVLEFLRLHQKSLHMSFAKFFLNINKVYVVDVVVWSLFLLLTGNRGEAMLIVLPPIILYFFYINKINNKTIILGTIVGVFAMVYIGLTRQGDSDFQDTAVELGAFGIFRDYGAAYVNQQGLIQYTDAHGTYGFSTGVKTLLSSVPFLGGFLIGGDSMSNKSEGNTNELTTEQWQIASNMDSGLGTNLLGDLYYAGGLLFVIVYFGILGWFLSYCYERLYNNKRLNAFSLFTFCWLFADCLYILRAPYYHLFRQIGFSLILYFFLYMISYAFSNNNMVKHNIRDFA